MEKQNKNCQDPILCSISPEPSAYGTKKTTKKNDRTQFSVSSPTPLGFAFFFLWWRGLLVFGVIGCAGETLYR
jgi:hypothetical protein